MGPPLKKLGRGRNKMNGFKLENSEYTHERRCDN